MLAENYSSVKKKLYIIGQSTSWLLCVCVRIKILVGGCLFATPRNMPNYFSFYFYKLHLMRRVFAFSEEGTLIFRPVIQEHVLKQLLSLLAHESVRNELLGPIKYLGIFGRERRDSKQHILFLNLELRIVGLDRNITLRFLVLQRHLWLDPQRLVSLRYWPQWRSWCRLGR